MNNREPVIKIRKLKIAFGSKVVLNEIDLDIFPGETLAVIGPSGSRAGWSFGIFKAWKQ